MRFEHERPGDFNILLEDHDIELLSSVGQKCIFGVRGGLHGFLNSKVSVVIDTDPNDFDRVEFDPGLDMTEYLQSIDTLPIVIDRCMLDPGGHLDDRVNIFNHYFGSSGSVVVSRN